MIYRQILCHIKGIPVYILGSKEDDKMIWRLQYKGKILKEYITSYSPECETGASKDELQKVGLMMHKFIGDYTNPEETSFAM